MSHLTIAYFSSRKEPMIQWFFDSLRRETGGDYHGIKIVVVDFWRDHRTPEGIIRLQDCFTGKRVTYSSKHSEITWISPKPTVWQGAHKLTKEDWFAASNARNTALCLAPDGYIAYVDDLSVLLPGWLARVREAMAGDPMTVTLGAYRKVKELVVENGNVVSFTDHPGGHDNRYPHGSDERAVECGGNWLYGCSLVGPVEAFLKTNGWPEALCDGMGFEDVITGLMLSKHGYRFCYDRRMMTYESEELHHQLPIMKRSDYGVSPNDKSHAVLHMAQQGNGWHPNYFGEEGIRGLRQRVLAGEPFPIVQIPQHEWYSKTPLKDL